MSLRGSWKRFAVRRLDMGPLLDVFLISAVSCVIVIRVTLHLTGYPQLGNDSLHIAHMLWGGLGMLLAVVVLIAFPVRLATQFAALVGGLGFGAFIDELGKFITQDNDYFFQPTIGLIYLLFVGLYLGFRQLEGVGVPSEATRLVNALELTKEAALRSMDAAEREQALSLLAQCDRHDPVVRGLLAALGGSRTVEMPGQGFLSSLKDLMVQWYRRLIAWRFFSGSLILGAVAVELVSLGLAVAAVSVRSPSKFGFNDWGSLLSALVSGLLVLAGVLVLRRSRLRSYKLFDGAVLVGIFVGQFFNFLENELSALAGLVFLLVCHGALRYLIDQEQTVRAHAEVGETRGAVEAAQAG